MYTFGKLLEEAFGWKSMEDTPIIIDSTGVERNWEWLVQTYGHVDITASGKYKCIRLDERKGDSACVVTVLDKNGYPVANQQVAWYWPDAPVDGACGHLGRCVHGPTNQNGNIGFGMGGGAYYWPAQGQIGPHAVWIYGGNSDLVKGIGMLGGTNHNHLDVVFQERGDEPAPEPEPEPEPCPDMDAVIALLREAMDKMNSILDILEN